MPPEVSTTTAEVVICGAGIAGVAAAYHLAVRRGVRDVVLVDERAPLTLTSDKSAECYRNWWPGPGDAMVALMTRSIDLLEELARESDNVFRMNRRGYLFATADPARASELVRLCRGSVRVRRGSGAAPRPPRQRLSSGAGGGLRGAADRYRRHHGSLDHPPGVRLARRGHDRAGPRAALRLVQRPAARHVHARAGARQGRAAARGAGGGGRDVRRAGERGEGECARRRPDDRDLRGSSTRPDRSWAASPASSASSCRSSASATARWRSTTCWAPSPARRR